MAVISKWILNQRDHLESLRLDPSLRDHMLAHGMDPDPDRFGHTIGEFDLGSLHFIHTHEHEMMCSCGRPLVMAEVQDMHAKAAGRLTMVCPVSYVMPEACKASGTAIARYHGYR